MKFGLLLNEIIWDNWSVSHVRHARFQQPSERPGFLWFISL